MEKKFSIWNDYQNQKNYDLSFKTVDDNAPDHIVLKETKDDRGKNGEQWNFKIVSKDYIDTKNAEQDETARQQQTQITEHSHTLREHEEKILKVEEKNTEQDGKLLEIENKNTEQDEKLLELENKNTEQDNKLSEHENRLEQLDGGHSSNLGKIGEIETTLDDHKGRLELLETETDNYNTRVYKKNLSAMELKLDNVLSLVKATVSIHTKKGETFTSHLSGLYVVDKKNNHNNSLNLFTDTKDNEKFYHIELSGDESFLIKIIHTKNIEIESVVIDEYSQVVVNIPFVNQIEEEFLPNIYHGSQFSSNTRESPYIADFYIETTFSKYDENRTLFIIDGVIHVEVKDKSRFTGLTLDLGNLLNEYYKKETFPKYYGGNYTKNELFKHSGYALMIGNKLLDVVTRSYGELFRDIRFDFNSSDFKEGSNTIIFKLGYLYDKTEEKEQPEFHL